jgi:hypothetical protein
MHACIRIMHTHIHTAGSAAPANASPANSTQSAPKTESTASERTEDAVGRTPLAKKLKVYVHYEDGKDTFVLDSCTDSKMRKLGSEGRERGGTLKKLS